MLNQFVIATRLANDAGWGSFCFEAGSTARRSDRIVSTVAPRLKIIMIQCVLSTELILDKLRELHRAHSTSIDLVIQQLIEVVQWLSKSTYSSEAKPIQEFASKKHRGPILIGDLMIPLLV
jgi:hypothetical protein